MSNLLEFEVPIRSLEKRLYKGKAGKFLGSVSGDVIIKIDKLPPNTSQQEFGEAVELGRSGAVRLLVTTAPQRLDEAPQVPTLSELGNQTVYANWRGFFAAPGTPDDRVAAYVEMFRKMYDTPQWKQARERHGWNNAFKPGREFFAFLEQQERRASRALQDLGVLD